MTVNPALVPLLETREVSRTFGHGDHMVRAVERMSFSMKPGEIVALWERAEVVSPR
jgi:ABC-type microcin C transport system duplicated ATPase subunit YejF